nr:NADH dehydrogenase subunit 2 [Cylindrotaenia sp. MN-2022]
MLYRFYLDVVIFSFFFSLVFCALCGIVDSLISFWVFLELCGLSIIPTFFYSGGSGVYGFYSALLSYVIMSGVSSVLVVSGILISSLYIFIFLGFVMKFGLFPFSMWVYRVFSGGGWLLIFLLSVVMKFPILFFCFLLQHECYAMVYVDCFFTILMCSAFMWLISQSWEYVWCHVSLSSVSTLMVACFCSSASLCFFIYFYYFFWGSASIFYFYSVGYMGGAFSNFWVYCFLLLVTPLSVPLFYKLGVCIAIFYSSFYVLLVWGVYSFSEQVFLYKLASEQFYSKVFNRWSI